MFVQEGDCTQPVSIVHISPLLLSFWFHIDGSDIIQQWCKFYMGALPPGPCICDERETQGQPSGQTAVSLTYFEVIQGYCCLDLNIKISNISFIFVFHVSLKSPNKSEFIRAKYQMLAFVHRMPCREDDSTTAKDLSKVVKKIVCSQWLWGNIIFSYPIVNC